MIKAAIRIEKIKSLTERAVQILELLADVLGDGEGCIPYEDIAKRLRCSRSTVKYTMDKLIIDGAVQAYGGKLSVRETIIWYEE